MSNFICIHPGCSNPGRAKTKESYCVGHQARSRKGQDMDAPMRARARYSDAETCKWDSCARRPAKVGFCEKHYHLNRIHNEHPQCPIDRCQNKVEALSTNLCQTHRKKRDKGNIYEPVQQKRPRTEPCDVDGCDNRRKTTKYCSNHNKLYKKYGDPLIKKKILGGRYIDNGYAFLGILHPDNPYDKKIQEHVVVYEKFLGRQLFPHENIHHKNGVRDDNRIENLELWTRSQPSGQRVEDKIEYCNWLLREYEGITVHQATPGPNVENEAVHAYLAFTSSSNEYRYRTSNGYIRVSKKHPLNPFERDLPEHQLIMGLLIGRDLNDHENVHHKNGIRDDNSPENLELWSKSQPCGQRVEDKIAWAKWLLSQYETSSLTS